MKLIAALLILPMSCLFWAGCAFDSWHNKDGSKKRPWQTDTGETNQVPVEMPGAKGQP